MIVAAADLAGVTRNNRVPVTQRQSRHWWKNLLHQTGRAPVKIRPLSKTDEKRLLASVSCQLNEPAANGVLARLRRELVLFLLAFSVFFVGLIAYFRPTPFNLFPAVIFLPVGFAIGLAAWRYTAATQWTALARCIDREKVEARLRELDARPFVQADFASPPLDSGDSTSTIDSGTAAGVRGRANVNWTFASATRPRDVAPSPPQGRRVFAPSLTPSPR